MTVSCSFCSKKFDTLQQLGGHQTRHREEMSALRRDHGAQMMKRRDKFIKMVVLPHNPAFWAMFRKYGIEPNAREFLPLVKKGDDCECEVSGTVISGEMSQEEGEGVDLTLKL